MPARSPPCRASAPGRPLGPRAPPRRKDQAEMTIDTTPPQSPDATPSLIEGFSDVAGEAAPTKMSKKRKSMIAALLIALVILALLFVWYLMNRKPLSELPGLTSTTMPHYEFSIYGMTEPVGVAANASGDRIYVTETAGENLVRVYDAKGKALGT